MDGRTGKKSSLLIVTLLAAASLAGCGGGGTGGATNPNTEAFTSALMNTGVFYLRGSNAGNHHAGKMTTSALPTVVGAEYSYTTTPAPAWAVTAPTGYFLDNAGIWQAYSTASSFVDNGDGSYTAYGIYNFSIDSVSDLAGQSPTCIDSYGATIVCPFPQTYATGAKQYSATATLLMDYYSLYYQMHAYTDLNGMDMAALPAAGSDGYCIQVIAGISAILYKKNGTTYDSYRADDCTGAGISAGLATLATQTGITITSGRRNGVTLAQINEPTASFAVGLLNGNYWFGVYLPVAGGTPSSNTYYNRTASDTLTAAHGLPVLP